MKLKMVHLLDPGTLRVPGVPPGWCPWGACERGCFRTTRIWSSREAAEQCIGRESRHAFPFPHCVLNSGSCEVHLINPFQQKNPFGLKGVLQNTHTHTLHRPSHILWKGVNSGSRKR